MDIGCIIVPQLNRWAWPLGPIAAASGIYCQPKWLGLEESLRSEQEGSIAVDYEFVLTLIDLYDNNIALSANPVILRTLIYAH